jgi:hypothetical protein
MIIAGCACGRFHDPEDFSPARGRKSSGIMKWENGGAVIAMIPCVVAYVALQRFCVRGLVSGALKG